MEKYQEKRSMMRNTAKNAKKVVNDPYDPRIYSDVFGGPPKSIYTLHDGLGFLPQAYDEVFNTDRDSLSGSGDGFNLPVFEVPVPPSEMRPSSSSGRSHQQQLPVFEIPCSRATRRIPIFCGADFYDDIFSCSTTGGGDGTMGNVTPVVGESATKTSRSASNSSMSCSSSQHNYQQSQALRCDTLQHMAKSVAKKGNRDFKEESYTKRYGLSLGDSEETSTATTSPNSSPTRNCLSDVGSAQYSYKTWNSLNGKNRRKTYDATGGIPQKREITHFKSWSPKATEKTMREIKIGKCISTLDAHNPGVGEQQRSKSHHQVFYSHYAHTPPMHSESNDYSPEVFKEVPNFSSMLCKYPQHPVSPPSRPISWKDLKSSVPDYKGSYIDSIGVSYTSPDREPGFGSQKVHKDTRSGVKPLSECFVNDDPNFDACGSYVVDVVSNKSYKPTQESRYVIQSDHNSTSDASDLAVREAIAWAKEKFMLGSWKYEQGMDNNVKKDNESQPWSDNNDEIEEVVKSSKENYIDDGNVTFEDPSRKRNMLAEKSQNIYQQEMELYDHHFVCQDEDFYVEEAEFRPSKYVDSKKVSVEKMSSKHTSTHDQNEPFEEEYDPLFHAPELQGASAIDATFDISTTFGLYGLLEDRTRSKFSELSLETKDANHRRIHEATL